MMKYFKKLVMAAATIAATVLVTSQAPGIAHAAQPPCFQYDPSGNFTTSSTPVFNDICGDTTTINSTDGPVPLGNESNFVRIRPDTSGNDTSNSTNPALRDAVTSACTDGSKFDIWTYIHNDALTQDNNNGTGSAVAKNVKLALDAAGLNTTDTQFNFSSTVSADNAAASVTDGASLTCNGQAVKLTLVPSSIKYTLNVASPTYVGLPDSLINTTFGVGNPTFPSLGQPGDQWGCYNYRIVVVYQVQVNVISQPQVTATCNMFNVLANSDRKVTVNTFTFTAQNVNFSSAVINWGDNTSPTTITDSSKVVGTTHQYANNGTYLISALVNFSNGATSGGPGSNCQQQLTVSVTPPNVTPPTTLVNTGPGEVVGLFGGASAAGAFGYRKFLSRRLGR